MALAAVRNAMSAMGGQPDPPAPILASVDPQDLEQPQGGGVAELDVLAGHPGLEEELSCENAPPEEDDSDWNAAEEMSGSRERQPLCRFKEVRLEREMEGNAELLLTTAV